MNITSDINFYYRPEHLGLNSGDKIENRVFHALKLNLDALSDVRRFVNVPCIDPEMQETDKDHIVNGLEIGENFLNQAGFDENEIAEFRAAWVPHDNGEQVKEWSTVSARIDGEEDGDKLDRHELESHIANEAANLALKAVRTDKRELFSGFINFARHLIDGVERNRAMKIVKNFVEFLRTLPRETGLPKFREMFEKTNNLKIREKDFMALFAKVIDKYVGQIFLVAKSNSKIAERTDQNIFEEFIIAIKPLMALRKFIINDKQTKYASNKMEQLFFLLKDKLVDVLKHNLNKSKKEESQQLSKVIEDLSQMSLRAESITQGSPLNKALAA